MPRWWRTTPTLENTVRIVLSDGATYRMKAAYPFKFVTQQLDDRNNPVYVSSSLDDLDDENYRRRMEAEVQRKERENSLKFAAKLNKKRPATKQQ
ncbi:hypothetical protein KFE25_005095 [Diacronema lutheri]|uniref:Uncharacterized protein n=2 Tax=Diacronema lutheri TaxID=2081491 RepID=A0A8J5X0R2_DIALT|nr:hypothetical protein KFE25_005095 [Diacronema lutheri]